jgi:hypothetical protein
MEPQDPSEKIIFETCTGVIIADLAVASLIILFMMVTTLFQPDGSGNLHFIPMAFGVILFGISVFQGLFLVPTAFICLITGKWELAIGYILGMLAIAFLSFTFCSFGNTLFR